MSRFFEVFGFEPAPIAITKGSTTAIVVVKNEALRLPHFLDHHRRIGVKQFFVIDDASDDATADLLDSLPDVVRIPSRGSFREYKSRWVSTIADTYLDGKWTLLLDADELLIYPGWPERSLAELIATLEAHSEEALFSSLVDMYSCETFGNVEYKAGEPLIDACPYFDPDGYLLLPRNVIGRKDLTPPEHIMWGTRQRLFFEKRPASRLETKLMQRFFSIHRQRPLGRFESAAAVLVWRWLRLFWLRSRPAMSKIPLLLWRAGDRINSGYHSVQRRMKVADEWGALLHFKYLTDFERRSIAGATAGQYGTQYSLYKERIEAGGLHTPFGDHSRRFTGVEALIEVGLMRRRPGVRRET